MLILFTNNGNEDGDDMDDGDDNDDDDNDGDDDNDDDDEQFENINVDLKKGLTMSCISLA
jgi:hypothetical protein